MKSAYIKPETEILSANIEAILNITSNWKEGREPAVNPITPGSDNQEVGANNGFFSYEDDSHYDDSHYDAWSNW